MIGGALRFSDRTSAAIQVGLGTFLVLFFLTAAAYLTMALPERSELQTISGVVRDKQIRGSKRRPHVEFDVGENHLYYDGPNRPMISSRIEPGVRITALAHPHAYRSGVLVVWEISVDGQVLVTLEQRRLYYRRFGYAALLFALLWVPYVVYHWRSMRAREPAG